MIAALVIRKVLSLSLKTSHEVHSSWTRCSPVWGRVSKVTYQSFDLFLMVFGAGVGI